MHRSMSLPIYSFQCITASQSIVSSYDCLATVLPQYCGDVCGTSMTSVHNMDTSGCVIMHQGIFV